MEPNSPKKIQFAVPLFQSQIDPEAAEQVRKTRALMTLLGLYLLQIRKRRPTPASLVIMNEHMPPGKKLSPCPSLTASLCLSPQSQSASPKQRKQSVFTPPALKG
ncbi:PPR1C phosphatase, partial [Daphoenositta chrysoptera]|nr:PPR1C phosphatase [Daphoenositta chrysoptera]